MNLNITRCPTCGSDQIKQVCRDWTGAHKGQTYIVPELTFYECPVCGERVFEREALAKIQTYSPAFAKRPPTVSRIGATKAGATRPATPPSA